MRNMKCDLFRIIALTNMHVGSGDISFGAVDNLVQKDVATDLPTINSSSLKGALREFFEQDSSVEPDLVKFVFGAEPSKSGKGDGKGAYTFFSANLLSIPARSNNRPFFRAISPEMIGDFLEYIRPFGISMKNQDNLELLLKISSKKRSPLIFKDQGNDIFIEDLQASYQDPKPLDLKPAEQLLGKDIAFFHNDDIKEKCSNLPVIPRNYLENGQSKNLWYEEVVPRQTLFYFIVASPKVDPNGYYSSFSKTLTENVIQIGANATIGYGYTKIEKVD